MAVNEQILIERILENENLTGDLEDGPASLLLKWGTSRVSRLVQHIDDPERAGARINALMAVMRAVNRLAGNSLSTPVEDLAAGLGQLVDLYARAFGRARAASAAELQAAAAVLAKTPSPQAVPFLLEWLAPGAPEEKK